MAIWASGPGLQVRLWPGNRRLTFWSPRGSKTVPGLGCPGPPKEPTPYVLEPLGLQNRVWPS